MGVCTAVTYGNGLEKSDGTSLLMTIWLTDGTRGNETFGLFLYDYETGRKILGVDYY